MRKKLMLIAVMILLSAQACADKDCEDVLCFTPPMPFAFELVDKDSGENLFTNGSYDSDDIEVLNVSDNSRREFVFISENELNIIQIGSIGWENEIAEVVLKVGDETILNLYVDSERVSEDCCNFTKYNEIRIDNADYELDPQSGIYTIRID
jgi:hypothetical protein